MKDQIYNGQVLRRECVFCQYHPSNAAKTGGTQSIDVQQLKTKIVADLNEAIGHVCGGTLTDAILHIKEALRQLLAV